MKLVNFALMHSIAAMGVTLFVALSSFAADVIDVPLDGDIAAAVEAAESGSVIQLAAGTYTLAAEVTIAKGVTVKGAGRFATIVQSDGASHRLFTLNDDDAVLSDLTVKGGILNGNLGGRSGAGLAIVKGTLQDAVVRDCEQKAGQYGAGVWMEGGAVRRCILTGNLVSGRAGGGALYIKSGSAEVENALVYGNEAFWGGGLYIESGATLSLVNCTFADNEARQTGADGPEDIYDYSGKLKAINCYLGDMFVKAGEVLTKSYRKGEVDPKFASDKGNYRLLPGSPLIGVGDPVSCATDVEGYAISETPSVGALQTISGTGVTEPAKLIVGMGGFASVSIAYPDGVFGAGTLTVVCPNGTLTETGVTDGATVSVPTDLGGNYSLILSVDGNAYLNYNAVYAGVMTVYADAKAANPVFPYVTPETAANSIAVAMAAVMDGGTVLVCDGEWPAGVESIAVMRPVTIQGANGRDKAVFLGDKASVFALNHPQAKLSGLTIRGNGVAGSTAGMGVRMLDGGTLSDCRIEKCYGPNSSDGGGVTILGGSARIERCVFVDNRGGKYGGGIYVAKTASLELRNSLFYANSAANDWGGGVYVDGSGLMANCTLYNNVMKNVANGELCTCNAAFHVQNCILGSVSWYDKSSAGRYNNLGSSSALADPGFADAANNDYRLTAGATAAIDAGDDDSVGDDMVDLAGAKRIQGAHVDIGCYEFAAEEFGVGITVEGTAAAVGDSVSFVPVVTGATNPHNSWRIVNLAGSADIVGETSGSGASAAFAVTFDRPGVYSVCLRTVDGENAGEASKLRCVTIRVEGDVFVAASGTPVAPYDTPETATTNLVAACRMVADGATVHIGEGTFTTDERLTVAAGTKVLGAGQDRTLVRPAADAAAHGLFTLNHADSSISQLTLTGHFSETYQLDDHGCGIKLKAGKVLDCCVRDIVVDRAGINGSAIYAEKSGKTYLEHVTVHGCRGCNYGSLYLQGPAFDCLLYDNEASASFEGDPFGGSVYIESGAAFATNFTVVGMQEKTFYNYNKESRFVNCVLDCPSWNQFHDSGLNGQWVPGINVYWNCASSAGNPMQDARLVENGNLSEVNLSLRSPRSRDYRLRGNSPCRGAGVFADWMGTKTDLDGRPFVRDSGKVDLGCYQTPPPGMMLLVR